jgi:uncharacterized membrane protein
MTVPAALLNAVQPWASLYGNSQPISVGVVFLHLAGLMIGGGRAIAADADVLATPALDSALVERLRRAHQVVIPALSVVFITGLLMAASDLELFAASGAFAVKLTLVALLSGNGFVLWLSEGRLSRTATAAAAWRVTRLSAGASLVLWLATLLAGCWLKVAA